MLKPRKHHLFACLLNLAGKEDLIENGVDLNPGNQHNLSSCPLTLRLAAYISHAITTIIMITSEKSLMSHRRRGREKGGEPVLTL